MEIMYTQAYLIVPTLYKEKTMKEIGKKSWIIPDMYWPEITSEGHYVSHESICVLNTSNKVAQINISLFYEDREPIKNLKATCEARRTHHIRMDALLDENGQHIPRGVAYASIVTSDVDVVVQYTRVDTTQKENALMTTMGY